MGVVGMHDKGKKLSLIITIMCVVQNNAAFFFK